MRTLFIIFGFIAAQFVVFTTLLMATIGTGLDAVGKYFFVLNTVTTVPFMIFLVLLTAGEELGDREFMLFAASVERQERFVLNVSIPFRREPQ